jgi:aldehyde dehydrogenase
MTAMPAELVLDLGLIDGRWVPADDGETFAVTDPATGAELARLPRMGATETERAIAAAAGALGAWRSTSAATRGRLLRRWADAIEERTGALAELITAEEGKPLAEAAGEIAYAASFLEWFGEQAKRVYGEGIPAPAADRRLLVTREAVGVGAGITPWNFPAAMITRKAGAALAAGCTLVVKPSEKAPLTALALARLAEEVGIPAGVVNVVTGYGAAVGEALVTHPDVRKVAFTGSVATARRIIQYASENVIPQTLELGGKSAHIVCADADIDAAVEAATMSTVLNKGEVCLAGSRMFLHEAIEEEFLEKFKDSLSKIRQGDPMDPATQLGAQASQMQMDKVQSYLKLAIEEGATAHIGGARNSDAALAKGHYIQPTIFTNVANDMRIAQEEIFGPVTTTMTWKDEDEMIKRANHTTYGLAGGVWTRDIYRAHRIARQLETGTVWINRYYNLKPNMPVGGYKQSGYGREFSHEVLNHYTQTKSVIVNLDDRKVGMFDQ